MAGSVRRSVPSGVSRYLMGLLWKLCVQQCVSPCECVPVCMYTCSVERRPGNSRAVWKDTGTPLLYLETPIFIAEELSVSVSFCDFSLL